LRTAWCGNSIEVRSPTPGTRDDRADQLKAELGPPILRTDDPNAPRQANRDGRDQMVERIAPFVDRVGIDTTFELADELTPAHA
jgi:hypothetical protein